jgi:hypothetical protein
MSGPPPPPTDLRRELTKAQIQKMNLEIAELTHRRRNPLKYIPVVTSLVAVIGLVVTVMQSYCARTDELRRNQENQVLAAKTQSLNEAQRLESQIRTDKEELLRFISDDKFTTARVMFLLDDLNGLFNQLSNRADVFGSKTNADLERQHIADLLQTITWQVSFHEDRHIDFDVQALNRWPLYRAFWIENGPSHHLLLSSKYYTAISSTYASERDCIEGLGFDEQRRIFISSSANKQCETGLFPTLVGAFKYRLEMMKKAGKEDFVRNELQLFASLTNHCKTAAWLEKELLGSSNLTKATAPNP